MKTSVHISAEVQLIDGVFYRNGKQVPESLLAAASDDWFREQYKALAMSYPKFHKMDELCKLAMLTADVLLRDESFAGKELAHTGLLLYNRHSSIDADMRHVQSISNRDNPMPSPAVFVYTLPNIMLGEICIRYRITGEHLCLISDVFDAAAAIDQCSMLFDSGMNQVLLGWIDHYRGNSKAWMAFVRKGEKAPNYSQFSSQIITEIDNIPQWKHS